MSEDHCWWILRILLMRRWKCLLYFILWSEWNVLDVEGLKYLYWWGESMKKVKIWKDLYEFKEILALRSANYLGPRLSILVSNAVCSTNLDHLLAFNLVLSLMWGKGAYAAKFVVCLVVLACSDIKFQCLLRSQKISIHCPDFSQVQSQLQQMNPYWFCMQGVSRDEVSF